MHLVRLKSCVARDLSFVARSRAFRSTDPLVKYVNHYIFTCKYKSKKLNTDALLNVITERFYVEKYLLLRNGEYAQYEKYWKKICDLLDNK